MKSPAINQRRFEKVSAGWFGGCNSMRYSWLLPDTQYVWSVNMENRGGIMQCRPGNKAVFSKPAGKFQGGTAFLPSLNDNTTPHYVFAVDGNVYAISFLADQPADNNWEPYRLKNITFSATADKVYFESTERSLSSESGALTIVPTYTVLMMQDGVSDAAYWDGVENGQLDSTSSTALQTPTGTLMKWVGNRLWLVIGNILTASDLSDPFSFRERVAVAQSDFQFSQNITGLEKTTADTRQASLIAFARDEAFLVNASIQDRNRWISGEEVVVTTLYPNTGCIASRSIVNHSGLLWWYSTYGLVNSDIAAATYLTSRLRVRDVEMGRSKRGFSTDVSNICATSFDNMLLVAVPFEDTYNSHIMVMDNSIADELDEQQPPAWCGVWTGIRPVEFIKVEIDGRERLFCASVDYDDSIDGTPNRLWEMFQADRRDSYEALTINNIRERTYKSIYWEVEFKALGDGMDLKRFGHAELDLVEIAGTVNLQVYFAGTMGPYKKILDTTLISTMDSTTNSEVIEAYNKLGGFNLQRRRAYTQNASILQASCPNVESEYNGLIDRAFSLLCKGCGWAGIGIFRMFMEPREEPAGGRCTEAEIGLNILTKSGVSVKTTGDSLESSQAFPVPEFSYSAPFTPKYVSDFYSSIPVSWQDLEGCEDCLPCSRQTSSAPTKRDLTIAGIEVY